MRVIVCGGRDYKEDVYFRDVMHALDDAFHGNTEIAHGGCAGADELAHEWAIWLMSGLWIAAKQRRNICHHGKTMAKQLVPSETSSC